MRGGSASWTIRAAPVRSSGMIDLICGARPNFMKIDPVVRAVRDPSRIRLVHTGQHYDHAMSQSFFDELGLPRPDVNLGVGSASITVQTATVMQRYEESLPEPLPEMTVVVGTSIRPSPALSSRYGTGFRSATWSPASEAATGRCRRR